MTILIQDSFNRANSTTGLGVADSGQSWQSLAGGWGISNNQAYWISGNPAISIIESGKSDVSISLDNIVASAGQSSGAVAFRITDDKNYWLFRNISGTNQLYKFVNGSATLVASKLYSLAEGVFKFKVVATSATIECYVNDILELTTTDTHNQTATRHGLRNHTGTTTRFDNFIVESLGIGGGDTGTDGTTAFDSRQSIYESSLTQADTKQIAYTDVTFATDLRHQERIKARFLQVCDSLFRQ